MMFIIRQLKNFIPCLCLELTPIQFFLDIEELFYQGVFKRVTIDILNELKPAGIAFLVYG